jgi:acetyl-CoA synthetase
MTSPASVMNDPVPPDAPRAREIGFTIPQRYNCAEILWHKLAAGRGESVTPDNNGG